MLFLVQHFANRANSLNARLSLLRSFPPRFSRLDHYSIHCSSWPVILNLFRLMRYFTEGFKHFSSSWDNRIHLTILTLLVISIGSDLVAPELTHHDGGIIAGVFLFILLGATCGILIYFFRKERDGKSAVTLMKFMSGTST